MKYNSDNKLLEGKANIMGFVIPVWQDNYYNVQRQKVPVLTQLGVVSGRQSSCLSSDSQHCNRL